MLLQLQEAEAAIAVANQLFPLLSRIVQAVEALAPHAPGPTKLDTAMAIAQNALTVAGNDATTVTQVATMAPSLIGLAKAQYNANLAAVQAKQPASAS